MKKLALAVAIAVSAALIIKSTKAQEVHPPVQSQIIFIKEPRNYTYSSTSTNWWFPYAVLSSSTNPFFADQLQGAHIKHARWTIVWIPNTSGATTGIRLVHFDAGPVNMTEFAKSEKSGTSPIHTFLDVTDQLNDLLEAGQFKYIGYQIRGNGSQSPLIYGSWLDIVWE
jgi:hypothetical protein